MKKATRDKTQKRRPKSLPRRMIQIVTIMMTTRAKTTPNRKATKAL